MICPKCGKEIGERESYCLMCGYLIKDNKPKPKKEKKESTNDESDYTLFIVIPLLILGPLGGLYLINRSITHNIGFFEDILMFCIGGLIIGGSILVALIILIMDIFSNADQKNKKLNEKNK